MLISHIDILQYIVHHHGMNLALALKALDNAHRRTVLSMLRDPGRHFAPIGDTDPATDGVCVAQISQSLGINQSTASSYMSLLLDAGLVSACRVGKYTRYKRDETAVQAVASAITHEL